MGKNGTDGTQDPLRKSFLLHLHRRFSSSWSLPLVRERYSRVENAFKGSVVFCVVHTRKKKKKGKEDCGSWRNSDIAGLRDRGGSGRSRRRGTAATSGPTKLSRRSLQRRYRPSTRDAWGCACFSVLAPFFFCPSPSPYSLYLCLIRRGRLIAQSWKTKFTCATTSQYRRRYGAPPVQTDRQLRRAARWVDDMYLTRNAPVRQGH
jgi:hypothetical protein